MAAHSPWDFRFSPDFIATGEPLGNRKEVDEYLRRVEMARLDYENFLRHLEAHSGKSGIVVGEFGDHQPNITLPELVGRDATGELMRFASAAYQTYYSVRTIRRSQAAELPRFPILDLGYLGLSLLEVAGLPLGPIYEAQRDLRDYCIGAFHTCSDRVAVDKYLKRLVASRLYDPP